ncbi:MAG: helix-turn-helix domain-containing protein [Myxococcales bacterium]|jgi:flagellar biosynthesis protein FlhG|nr:helix-turn-helix domain-containing protein [Myxococcales bacterium]
MAPDEPSFPVDTSDFDPDVDSPSGRFEAPEAVRGARRLFVVGGGRGGVGKSLVAENLAVYFAQLGKSVVLVDADPTGPNLHAHFGLPAAREPHDIEDGGDSALKKALVTTLVPGLQLLPAAVDAVTPAPALRGGRKIRWLSRLRSIPADVLVVDVGPGVTPFAVDMMLAADVPICVTVPEPPAIETTYRFVRAAYRRALRRALSQDRFRLSMMERALVELAVLPKPLELVRALVKMDRGLAELAWIEANRLKFYLVVNQTRVRTDAELGTWMSELTKRHYGVTLEELGNVENDDTVWVSVRRRRPLLTDVPTSKAARNIERIARRVVALTATRKESVMAPPPMPETEESLYAALGLSRSSSDEEIRRAYKRKREIYATGGLATSSMLDESEMQREQTLLEEAYDTLLDPIRRRAYDLSAFPEPEAKPADAEPRPALAMEQILLKNELLREIGPDSEFSGALLRKVRESQGIEVLEISAKTKITRAHLEAIEEERFADLPAMVYVRGFVTELAKFLKLDPMQVQKTYLRRMREGP